MLQFRHLNVLIFDEKFVPPFFRSTSRFEVASKSGLRPTSCKLMTWRLSFSISFKSVQWDPLQGGGTINVLYRIHILYCMQYKTSLIKVNGGLQKILTFLTYFCSFSFTDPHEVRVQMHNLISKNQLFEAEGTEISQECQIFLQSSIDFNGWCFVAQKMKTLHVFSNYMYCDWYW